MSGEGVPGTPDSTEAVGGSETLSIATISSTPDVGTVDELEGKWGCFKGGGGVSGTPDSTEAVGGSETLSIEP